MRMVRHLSFKNSPVIELREIGEISLHKVCRITTTLPSKKTKPIFVKFTSKLHRDLKVCI